jgi:flagellar hook-length control protein FliK
MAARDFAAHMPQADTQASGPEQAVRLPGESAGFDRGDGPARGQQVEPAARDPEVTDRHPPAIRVGMGEVQTIAEASVEGMPALIPSGGGQAAAIAPETSAVPEHVEAGTADRSDPSQPEASFAETGSGPGRPIAMPPPDQLSPADAPAPGTGRNDLAQAPQLPADTVSTGSGTVASAPAVAPGTGDATARQSAAQAFEAALAGDGGDTAGAAALPAAGSPTSLSGTASPAARPGAPSGGDRIARVLEPGRTLGSQGGAAEEAARAVEPRRTLAPSDGADVDDRGLLQERPAAPDGPLGSQVRGTDPGARQQLSSDAQAGRLPPVSSLHGAAAGLQPAAGVSGAVAQVVARAPDGVVDVGTGPDAAARQIALQITKALDQDRTEIRIRLDPPELGEVDIQLEFRDLRLIASINAERPDTLDLLQRDSRSLARALREAGLELADSDLSFAHDGRNDRPDTDSQPQRLINLPHPLVAAAQLQDLPLALASADGFVSLSDGRMDLRV